MKVKSIGVATLVAASMAWTPANAADLGGDCCADLEERVAELEATTARKGNRKVSLTISGQVNELVYWWDDGVESNVYVGTNQFSNSRFRFKGDAKISADWSAGYYIEIQVVSAGTNAQTADNDDLGGGIGLRHSAWYLKSKTLGTFWVGQHSHATDNIVLFANGGTGTATAANYNVGPGAGLFFRDNSFGGAQSTLRPSDFLQFLDTDRANIIRYDSPSIAGFVVSASWGEDDMWDVALTYAGEFAGFKVSGGIGYHVERDSTGDAGPTTNSGNVRLLDGAGNTISMDFEDIRGSISVLHAPSGLFLDFAGVHREFDVAPGVFGGPKSDFNFWMLRGGIYQRFFAIGKTSIFGEYAEATGALEGSFADNSLGAFFPVLDDKLTLYGVGINQYIDAAAMEIYLGWRHMETDLTVGQGGGLGPFAVPLDDIDVVYTGARIQF